jgi:hypothetical protein
MRKFPILIPTESLALSDVPAESASWPAIGTFALTFDPAEDDPYHLKQQDLATLSASSSLVQLRSHLFLEQRRWNHFGREPDAVAMSAIRRIVSLIRAKLANHVAGAAETEI